ncbi:MAG TPA: error-prone DNA polymerase [Burkholderiaceae bacterium]
MLPDYAELLCRSNFSFLTGASSPEELVDRAAELRYSALAITDECSLSGVVHAHERATEVGLHLIVGAEMRLEAGVGGLPMRLVLLATTHRGYSNLSQWISLARRRAEKGRYEARAGDVEGHAPIEGLTGLPDCLALLLPTTGPVRIGAQIRPSAPGGADEGRAVSGNVLSPAATSSQPMPSSQSVIAIARARAAATIATNKPGAGRPGGRVARQMRDGAAAVDPSEPVTDTPEGVAPAALREAKPAPMPEFVNRPSAALPVESLFSQAQWLKTWFGLDRGWLALPMLGQGDDDELRERVKAVARATGLRIVAVGDVLMATHSAKPLQDVLTATRLQCTLGEAGHALSANAEAHLRGRARLRMLFDEAWMAETMAIAGRCKFSLSEIKYTYPQEIVPKGHTPASWLRQLTEEGAVRRFGANVPHKARRLIEHELDLIGRLKYEAYFLTVADIVRWARSRRILCQGRGSAANSAVCYCLGVTEVDPDQTEVLFERFISEERGEPPDIDIDFEHQRREEVIQYIYDKYGRHRAALTGVITRYRTKSAVRDVGRALGVDLDRINAVTRSLHHVGGSAAGSAVERLALSLMEHGFDPDSRLGRNWIALSMKLRGQPRHLSQHPGGFLIAREDVARMVPVENAAMDGRTVIQWDKDDLDVLGLLKVDILALGMLSALKRAIVFVDEKVRRMGPLRPEWLRGETAPDAWSSTLTLEAIPKGDDPAVFAMLSAADSVGVFQVESRAQMSMLPRLRPEAFYDLVVEVAIVRPGPIQGGMVHPYLKRREKKEAVDYPSPEVEEVLKRTLGVPIFQEQVMQLAVVAADFTPGEADQLRRAMAAWKRKGGLEPFQEKLTSRMLAKGYAIEFIDNIFKQIQGFGEYGFPESHAASFASLVYASSWIKRYHPDAFLAALLNSLPMGFYAAPQLVRDARAHGVAVRPVDILVSDWDSTLEPALPEENVPACAERFIPSGLCAVRLGLGRVQGLDEREGRRIERARARAPFVDVEDLARRAGLDDHALQCLAAADALGGLSGGRRESLWAVAGVDTRSTPLLKQTRTDEGTGPRLESLGLADAVLADYQALGLSLKCHPLALLRSSLAPFKVEQAVRLNETWRSGQLARACGLVTHRQQPGTAKGVVFVTLEDETGVVNVIVWPAVAAAQRRPLLGASLLTVYGVWQREGEVRHLVAKTLVDHTPMLQGLATRSRDFH